MDEEARARTQARRGQDDGRVEKVDECERRQGRGQGWRRRQAKSRIFVGREGCPQRHHDVSDRPGELGRRGGEDVRGPSAFWHPAGVYRGDATQGHGRLEFSEGRPGRGPGLELVRLSHQRVVALRRSLKAATNFVPRARLTGSNQPYRIYLSMRSYIGVCRLTPNGRRSGGASYGRTSSVSNGPAHSRFECLLRLERDDRLVSEGCRP